MIGGDGGIYVPSEASSWVWWRMLRCRNLRTRLEFGASICFQSESAASSCGWFVFLLVSHFTKLNARKT